MSDHPVHWIFSGVSERVHGRRKQKQRVGGGKRIRRVSTRRGEEKRGGKERGEES